MTSPAATAASPGLSVRSTEIDDDDPLLDLLPVDDGVAARSVTSVELVTVVEIPPWYTSSAPPHDATAVTRVQAAQTDVDGRVT